MAAVEVDVYSDIVCPRCFIVARRLHAVLASFGGALRADVRHHPYLLHADAPPEGIDLGDMLASKYGAEPGGTCAPRSAFGPAALPDSVSRRKSHRVCDKVCTGATPGTVHCAPRSGCPGAAPVRREEVTCVHQGHG